MGAADDAGGGGSAMTDPHPFDGYMGLTQAERDRLDRSLDWLNGLGMVLAVLIGLLIGALAGLAALILWGL